MAHLTYKGHTDIYVPFPKIAFKKPNDTSSPEYTRKYWETMDRWLTHEISAENYYDIEIPNSKAYA